MLENHLKANLCWADSNPGPSRIDHQSARRLTGRFATAHEQDSNVVLTRDALGLNKLFFGHHLARGVVAATYLIDLIEAGIPFSDIYAVPAGSTITIDIRHRTTATCRFYALPATSGSDRPPDAIVSEIADGLTRGMQQLAATRPSAPIAICLSGGADSAVIAVFARRHFPHAVAYTYAGGDGELSEDAIAAQAIARHLGLPMRLVTADADMILRSLQRAIRFGQDWRDFNVHAAIVNDLLAAAIAADRAHDPTGTPLVLTGDLMNELLGDYSPIRYSGSTFYSLPPLSPAKLRIALTRGIQAGDREVGVFSAHGVDVAQPYGWVFEQLLELPNPVLKYPVVKALAGSELPDRVLRRPKVRAQVGDHTVRRGILPRLLDAGYDGPRLEAAFCRTFSVSSPGELRGFLRAGIYRPPPLSTCR